MNFSTLPEGLKIAVDGVLVGQIMAYSLEKDVTDPENLLPYVIKVTLRLQPPAEELNLFGNSEHQVVVVCNGVVATYKKCRVLKLQEEWGADHLLYRTIHFYAPARE